LEFALGAEFYARSEGTERPLAAEREAASERNLYSSFRPRLLSGISRTDGIVLACPPTEQGFYMENSESSAEAAGLPATGLHWRTRSPLPVPDDFFPLRLILQPSGASVELTQPDMLIGRHSQADVRLPLPDVSRRHCRFFFGQGVWQVLDLNSLNGVFVNGEAIRQSAVRHGDLIRIGGFTFAVDLCGAPPEATEAEASEGLIRGIFKTLSAPRRRAS
jgi:hypothetical protein